MSYKTGSRDTNTTFYYYKGAITVICGCFKGTLEEFEKKVNETHGENEHGIAYKKLIEKVKTIFKEDSNNEKS